MSQSEAGSVRISNQYRDRHKGMVYELRTDDARLVLSLQSADARWQFSAYARQSPELVIMGEWKATRGEAFRSMRDVWLSKGHALVPFDWDQVAEALTQVRALGGERT